MVHTQFFLLHTEVLGTKNAFRLLFSKMKIGLSNYKVELSVYIARIFSFLVLIFLVFSDLLSNTSTKNINQS